MLTRSKVAEMDAGNSDTDLIDTPSAATPVVPATAAMQPSQHGARAGCTTSSEEFATHNQDQAPSGFWIQEFARAIREVPIERTTYPTFSGAPTENPAAFLTKMQVAMTKRHIPQEEWVAASIPQLRGEAAQQFSLPKETSMDWRTFTTTFNILFASDSRVTRFIAQLYGVAQQPREPVLSFINTKASMASWLEPSLPETKLVRIIMELLQPNLRYVLRKQRIQSIGELMREALETEQDIAQMNEAPAVNNGIYRAPSGNGQRRPFRENAPPRQD